jgi:hypothetical protein
VHDPAKVLLDLAVTLGLGGDCLADIAVLRAAPGAFGPVASDPTVSRTIDALAADAPAALNAICAARAAARRRAWELAGQHAPDAGITAMAPPVIDIDATLITAHSDKELARPTFKRGHGHHPLWAFADHGAPGTGKPLAVMMRAETHGRTPRPTHQRDPGSAAAAAAPHRRHLPQDRPEGPDQDRRRRGHARGRGLHRRAADVVLCRIPPA